MESSLFTKFVFFAPLAICLIVLMILISKFIKESSKKRDELNSLKVSNKRISIFPFFIASTQFVLYVVNEKTMLNLWAGIGFTAVGLYLFFIKQDG